MSKYNKLIELNHRIQDQLSELKLAVAKNNSPWMSLGEAAYYCDLSYSTFTKIYKERIPHSLCTGNPKFHRDDLDKWMNDHKVEIY